ncbi:MAG: response regulator [Acidobacteriales bacterium]|nr:response regulator [Terriglobales bacterium]
MTAQPANANGGKLPLRVLVIEDSEADAELSLRELRRAGVTFESVLVANERAFLEQLRRGHCDLILSDYNLPGWSGMAAFEALRREGKDIPFILVTGSMGEQAAVECMKRGISDYILKDRLARLPLAVRQAVEEKRQREARQQAEERLFESTARFQAVTRATQDVIWDWDLRTDTIWRSENLQARFGFVAGEIEPTVGWWEERIHPDDRERVSTSLRDAVNHHGETWSASYRLRRGDEGYASVLDRGRVLHDPAGRPIRMLGVLVDVTDHLQMERQISALHKFEALGRLAGGIAHDFNNLLGAIIGFSELLLDQVEGNDSAEKYVTEIRKAGNRAAQLTRQLMAFSRKQVLEPKVLDLNSIITDMSEMLRRLIGEDVQIDTIASPHLGTVKADPGQTEQVILNLVINARDAMPMGGKLTIETANVDLDETYARMHVGVTPGRYVMLAISDTGAGMDSKTLACIFEPFFTTKKTGTGLGLATVFGIVKQSGGNIWVYSEPGRGTTFKVYIPRVDEPRDAVAGTSQVTVAAGGSETVLLVEDSEPLRMVAYEFLSRAGYKVLQALDANDVTRFAEQDSAPIHLLLTDVVMPEMSGREVAELVKRHHARTKVLFMSGYTDDAILRHGIVDQGVAFLSKPFSEEGLVRKVRQVLDARD